MVNDFYVAEFITSMYLMLTEFLESLPTFLLYYWQNLSFYNNNIIVFKKLYTVLECPEFLLNIVISQVFFVFKISFLHNNRTQCARATLMHVAIYMFQLANGD